MQLGTEGEQNDSCENLTDIDKQLSERQEQIPNEETQNSEGDQGSDPEDLMILITD